ncbi:MAG TPA: PaaI family thioesterase [Candidatus Limnocylindrales bacterium]|nr:PaaI family thioesterase [Candidatus Limnocylindrales bacterium]
MTFEEIRASADRCFGCGQDNQVGLKLQFHEVEKGVVRAKTILSTPYQGYNGIAHGGIICTLLDEAMAYAALYASRPGRVSTARMETRFSKPVPIGKEIYIMGWVAGRKRNILETEGKIQSPDGDILASATGKYVWVG